MKTLKVQNDLGFLLGINCSILKGNYHKLFEKRKCLVSCILHSCRVNVGTVAIK